MARRVEVVKIRRLQLVRLVERAHDLRVGRPLMVSGRSTLPSHMSRQDCPGWLNCQQTLWMRTPPSWQWSRTPIIESGSRNAATIVYNG